MKNKESSWKDFMQEGSNFLLKAKRWSENNKFNNDVIYNLILMSIEKNFMALCMKNNYLPENHTISDLIDAVNRIIILDRKLQEQLMEIEKYQQICTVNDYNRDTEKIKDINLVLQAGNQVDELVKKYNNNEIYF